MKRNLGMTDRVARWIIACIIFVLYFTGTLNGIIGNILLGLAIVISITGTFARCPIYYMFGLNTCRIKESVVKKD